MPLKTRANVEIVRVGTYELSTGMRTFTRGHLASAVAAANSDGALAPRLKLGHVDPRFDGEPAIGRVRNLRLSDDGDAIIADYTDMPAWLADTVHAAYPGRSIEGMFRGDELTITGVALLGITAPGITTLADLEQQFSEEGPLVAASGEDAEGRFIQVVIASTEEAAHVVDVAVDQHKAGDRPPPPPKEESTMDPKQLRESIGLAENASDDDVTVRLAELNARPESIPDDVVPAAEVEQRVEEAVAAARKEEREKIAASGGKVIDEAELEQLRQDAQAGRAARDEQIKASRKSVVETAIQAGKFPPARRDHYLALMERDEDGTRTFIESLEANAIPITERGVAASGPDAENALGDVTSTGWFPQHQEA